MELFIVRNEVVKVIFSQACVSTGGGVCLSACWDANPTGPYTPLRSRPTGTRPPLEQTPPRADTPRSDTPPGARPFPPQTRHSHTPGSRYPSPRRDSYCCRRYASYWNAFLLNIRWRWHFWKSPITAHVTLYSNDDMAWWGCICAQKRLLLHQENYFISRIFCVQLQVLCFKWLYLY